MTQETTLDSRIHAFRTDLADVSLRALVEAQRYVDPRLFQCINGVAPVYEAPSLTARRVSETRYGEFLDVFEQRPDGFSWVQNRIDRSVGYMQTEGALIETIAALVNRINVLRTFVYAEPDINAPIIDTLTMGSYVSLEGEEGSFYPLASSKGYIFKKHVAPTDEVFTADYVFTAGLLLGCPYRTGGRTPLGFDAEGLVQFVLDLAGYETPRFYAQQIEMFSQPLPCHWRDVLWRRGDLVFFENPQHIGIMTGDDHIIHANPYDMVVCVEPMEVVTRRGYKIAAAGRS